MKGNKDTGGQAIDSKRRRKVTPFVQSLFMLLARWVRFSEQHKFRTRILKFSALLPRKRRCVYICLEISQMHVRNGPSRVCCQIVHRASPSLMQRTSFSGQKHLQTMLGREEGEARVFWATGCQGLS